MRAAKHSRRSFRIAVLLAALGLFGGRLLEAKRRDDVIVMKDGDKFTGEIKKLENGILYFKAEYMVDSVQLDWARLESLESKDRFNVLLTDGKRMTGVIGKLKGSDFVVQSDGTETQVKPVEVVSLHPIEKTVLAQMTGSADYGFNFTGGNSTIQSNLSGNVQYSGDRWRAQASGSSVFSHQTGANNSGRNDLSLLYLKSVSDHWFVGALSTLLSSDQQDLTLRVTGGGGVARDLLRTGTAGVFALTGVVFSREQYSSLVGDQPHKNAEAEFQVQFFKYAFRRLQFSGNFAANPSLTTPGRVRLGAGSSLKIEIVRNLYWKLSFYENYDTRPPPPTAPKNDFGTSTSLGWTF
jgi:hypothetical protein